MYVYVIRLARCVCGRASWCSCIRILCAHVSVFVNIPGETVVIQTDRRCSIFRTTCVKTFQNSLFVRTNSDPTGAAVSAIAKDGRHKHRSKKKIAAREIEGTRKEHLDGLLANGTFIPIPREKIPEGTRILGSRFIDQLKNVVHGLRRKSRIVAQNYGHQECTTIFTKARTVHRLPQRIPLILSASLNHMGTFSSYSTRDAR